MIKKTAPGLRIHLALLIGAFLLTTPFSRAQDYAVGADLSFMKMAEDNGFSFKEDGQGHVLPVIQVFDKYTRR